MVVVVLVEPVVAWLHDLQINGVVGKEELSVVSWIGLFQRKEVGGGGGGWWVVVDDVQKVVGCLLHKFGAKQHLAVSQLAVSQLEY